MFFNPDIYKVFYFTKYFSIKCAKNKNSKKHQGARKHMQGKCFMKFGTF